MILPLSGIANLVFVARERHFSLPAAFVEVLGAKVAAAVRDGGRVGGWHGERRRGSAPARRPPHRDVGERRLLWLYGAMAAMGAVALMLGLWLAGSA